MTRTRRLDLELVERGLSSSRSEARRLIEDGLVTVGGIRVDRPASQVKPDDKVAIADDAPRFVSRGGAKLDSALSQLDVIVEGRRWLDAGASTGGFTDRLIQGGARAVVAVDVGYGQFDWRLRNDDRVALIERKNVRDLQPEDLPWKPEGVVADLSFISLRTVLPVLAALGAEDADYLLLVKPQFEVGRERVDKGVVRDPEAWEAAISGVVESAGAFALGLLAVTVAEPPGPSGNREFFVHLRRGATEDPTAVQRAIGRAT